MRFINPTIFLTSLLFLQSAILQAQPLLYPTHPTPFNIASPVAYQQPVSDSIAEKESQPRRMFAAEKSASPVPLTPQPAEHPESTPKSDGFRSLTTILAGLAVVLGLFFLTAWLLRRASPHRVMALPEEVFEILGRASLANHQQAQLIRCGEKLLLVSVASTAGAGARTLTEITDPNEVEHWTDLCRRMRTKVPGQPLRQMFRKAEKHND